MAIRPFSRSFLYSGSSGALPDLVADALGPELRLAVSLQASLCAVRNQEQRLFFAAIDRTRMKPTKKDHTAAADSSTMGGSSAAL